MRAFAYLAVMGALTRSPIIFRESKRGVITVAFVIGLARSAWPRPGRVEPECAPKVPLAAMAILRDQNGGGKARTVSVVEPRNATIATLHRAKNFGIGSPHGVECPA